MIPMKSHIRGRISKIEPYGVYLECEGDRILVLRTNLNWPYQIDDYQDLRLGDLMEVVVLDYNDQKQQYVGSRKHIHPEANPYLKLAEHHSTDNLHGKVRIVHRDGIAVEVEQCCIGNLPYDDYTKELVVGDAVTVQIKSVDPTRQSLELRLSGSTQTA